MVHLFFSANKELDRDNQTSLPMDGKANCICHLDRHVTEIVSQSLVLLLQVQTLTQGQFWDAVHYHHMVTYFWSSLMGNRLRTQLFKEKNQTNKTRIYAFKAF